MPFSLGTPAFPHRLLQVACGYETGVSQFGGVTSERCYLFIRLLARTDLGVQCEDHCQLRDNRDVVDLAKTRLVSAKDFGDLLQLLTHRREGLGQRGNV